MNKLMRTEFSLSEGKKGSIECEDGEKVTINLIQQGEGGQVINSLLSFSNKKLTPSDILNYKFFHISGIPHYEIIEICDMYNKFVRERGLFDETLAIKKIECGMESPWTMHNTIRDGGIIEWYGRKYRLSEI
jgi:hypothetical protein